MTPVLAVSKDEFKRFLHNNKLSENKFFYLTDPEQLYAREKGSIVLMFESFKAKDNYQELIKLARHRNMDCVRVL